MKSERLLPDSLAALSSPAITNANKVMLTKWSLVYLVVMGGDTCWRGCEFESLASNVKWIFFSFICCKMVLMFEKDARDGPFKKRAVRIVPESWVLLQNNTCQKWLWEASWYYQNSKNGWCTSTLIFLVSWRIMT